MSFKEIEKEKRLSESILWELQHAAYSQFGPEAWANKGVPFYLTSNPLIAGHFARVILGYLRDCLHPQAKTPIDPSQPIYIFDLGAGSGRLGFLILKHLLPRVAELFGETLRVKYVMTDMVSKNLDYVLAHPNLKGYVEQGVLDAASYRHDFEAPLRLMKAGTVLTQEIMANPVILVCTYYFDTIPQDLFKADKGRLFEGRITLQVPEEIVLRTEKGLNPDIITHATASYTYTPVQNPGGYYFGHADLNTLLEEYARNFDNTPFLFPFGSFVSLKYFLALSQGRCLLLAGDQGVVTDEQIRQWGEPRISRHASFSMAVSYHAIARFFQRGGGEAFLTSAPSTKFVVMAGIAGGSQETYVDTFLSFRDTFGTLEPVEYLELTDFTDEALQQLPLEHLLYLVKLGNWDPINFYTFFSAIRSKLPGASGAVKKYLVKTIHKVWENCYPLGPQEGEFIMNLGCLLFEMERYEDALLFFQRAKRVRGDTPTLLKNLSLCYVKLGKSGK